MKCTHSVTILARFLPSVLIISKTVGTRVLDVKYVCASFLCTTFYETFLTSVNI
jgi:hypothetical protein